jgi:serpin B
MMPGYLNGGTVFAVLLAFLCASVAGCGSTPKTSANVTSDPAGLVKGNTRFALALYGELRTTPGNLFLSPYSISSALAMTYAGAKGNTAKEMADVLAFALDGDSLHGTFGAVTDNLNAKGSEGRFDLSVANALWGQEGYKFLKAFLDLNDKYYGAGLENVDFAGDTEGARSEINAWVEEKTNHKIKDLLGPGVLDALTRLVLTNAIYFKGKWAEEFDDRRTKDEQFKVTAEATVPTPMMHQTDKFGYMETDTFQALELPYVGGALSMVVLLPGEVDGLPELERALTVEALTGWLEQIRGQEVSVTLPRFKVTSQFGLGETLTEMGMKDAFRADAADFSGMTGRQDLYISAVVHKAFVDVNEEGTEAAAATGVATTLSARLDRRPKVFRADHPFLFMIREKETGSILFMGRLASPKD